MNEQFTKDVIEGLSKPQKSIPSKYFYDKIGSALFSKIMQLPEYYLTRAELDIFKTQSEQIIQALNPNESNYFELIELGAGDGLKTIELLKKLTEHNHKFDYLPIDISQKALNQLSKNLTKSLPNLHIIKQKGDYFGILNNLKDSKHPKVVLFLGSNIGNMSDEKANVFLKELSSNLSIGDKILLGVDLIKSEEIVLPAYNDSQGVTRDFNLNLLRRMNTEFDADFVLDNFEHQPEYSENDGTARSFIKSKIRQTVNFNQLDFSCEFKENETIATEVSRKYNDEIITKICEQTRLEITNKFTDSESLFTDYLLEKTY